VSTSDALDDRWNVTKIRVLVVDDSVVVRRIVSDVLGADPDIEVVATAVNGRIGVQKATQLKPDLITMDIEMPELDGIAAVRELRRTGIRTPIIMFSTLTDQGATTTLDALAAGATDYVTKPANVGSVGRSMDQVRGSLIPRIKALVPRARGAASTSPAVLPPRPVATAPEVPARAPVRLRTATSAAAAPRVLVIGCSTGGPEALSVLLQGLPRPTVPVAVVQHMPPVFTRQFAARLDRQLPYDVVEAEHGARMEPGTVHIAPGDWHLRLTARNGALTSSLRQDAPENYCRPAVDVLFRSAVEAFGGAVLGVVLTGMGQDGARGAQAIVDRGGRVVVQDQASSVVWGMPGAVAGAGLAEEVLPLIRIASSVQQRLTTGSVTTSGVSTAGVRP
jgi:two-component system, chemotaxis family, protein-glutamate methylesterase/glutaminase